MMTASTPPGRSTRSQAAYSSPGPPSGLRPRRPGAAGDGQRGLPAPGLPGGEQSAGPPGRSRAPGTAGSGRGAGTRPRTRRPAAAAASVTAGEEPPAAATRSPGTENVSMTRRAAAAVTGPPHGGPAGVPPGRAGRARRSAARRGLSGRPGGRGRAWLRGGPALAVRRVEGLCHGGWSRVPPLSALTLQKSGFRGLFSRARRRNIRGGANYAGNRAGKSFRGFPGAGGGPLPHGVYLPCTWRCTCDIPRRGGAGQRPNVPGRRGSRAGAGRAPGRAGRQVQARYIARYTAGTCARRRAGARYIAGTRQVDRGWLDGASFPSASPAWSFPWINHPAAPEPFDAADAAFRLLCAGPRPLALHASQARGRPAGPAGAAR